jgi:hypothetical protein
MTVANGQLIPIVEVPSPEEERAKGRRAMTDAWVVLWAAFGVCVLLTVSIPLGISSYLASATSPRAGELSILAGTVLVRERGARIELNAADGKALEEGDVVSTTANSQAVLWLPEGSNLRIWPNTKVGISRLRSTTHNDRQWTVQVYVYQGHARLEVGLPLAQEHRFVVETPHGQALLREGSYTIEVAAAESDVIARHGTALIVFRDVPLEIQQSQRATLRAGEPPEGPLAAARNLITNGDFTHGTDSWMTTEDAEEPVVGTTSVVQEADRYLVVFRRQGGAKHGENRMFQPINRDVSDLQSLQLKLDLAVNEQTLAGGGWQGSEYPLQIRIRYRDVYDSEAGLTRGFYFQNNEGHPTPNGIQMVRNQWHSYTVDLFDPASVSPRPNYLLSIEVVGSGWSYESRFTDVRLVAE